MLVTRGAPVRYQQMEKFMVLKLPKIGYSVKKKKTITQIIESIIATVIVLAIFYYFMN